MPPAVWFEKVEFSAADAPLFQKLLDGGRKSWIVCGMETHICVYQTARALIERGYRVFVPVDAVVSRQKHNFRVGIRLMESAGAVATSTETLLFDLLGSAEGEVRVSVTDRGIGIPPEELEGVFERFRRGGSALAMNEEGLGLGLPVAKAIVEAHKGRIEMASRPGKGTTVTVALPADTEAKA